MHLSENEGIEGKTFVVTGGTGMVGSALCIELVRRGAAQVRAFDFRPPSSPFLSSRGVLCIQGDVTRKKDVEKAVGGADCVFHLASYGMSGKQMLQLGRIDDVNINGTCHVIEACIDLGVQRLVYLSTYNVVFGGNQIVNGNEAWPYYPYFHHHFHPYAHTVSIAEQLLLKHNGRPLKNHSGKRLYTCAVRPAAIYGPGEDTFFQRIISYNKLGLFLFRVGDASVKTDWVYVENLALALILASMGLLDDIPGREGNPVAAGQPYFISDGSPVNTWEFLRPLLRNLDYDLPKTSLSVPQALVIGRIFWFAYTVLYPWLNRWWLPEPMILPAEVYKTGVTHYFSYLKAKEELGYIPMVTPQEGLAATISYWQERKRKSLDGPTIDQWLFAIVGMFLLFCAAFLPALGPVPPLRSFGLFFFRSLWIMRIVFVLSVAAHIGEATYAWHLARRVDRANARGWFWQTFLLGFFSLRFLLKRAQK